jgi:predicted ATPase
MTIITKEEICYTQSATEFWFDGEYQYLLENEHEMNAVRLWAFENEVEDMVEFKWNGHTIKINQSGDLTSFPVGWYDQVEQDLIKLVKIKRSRNAQF